VHGDSREKSSPLIDFSIFSDLRSTRTFVDSGIVKPDIYRPRLVIMDVYLSFANCTQNCGYSCRKFASGNYTVLCNILSTYGCFCVYDAPSLDVAVTSLNAIAQDAMGQTIPQGFITKSTLAHWFSGTLTCHIRKNKYLYRRLKKKKTRLSLQKIFFLS
jgi:hypothetical protein